MAIATSVDILTAPIFRPRDLRDPLGVWTGRIGVTGDASGGGIKVGFTVPEENAGAHVHTFYSFNSGQLTGILEAVGTSLRLITNWPNSDPVAGIQGYDVMVMGVDRTQTENTGQRSAPTNTSMLFVENARFIPLYDPRPSAGQITIVEIQRNDNTDLATYVFQVFGYYWDRQVMDTPGGLRHPGTD